VVVKVLLVVEVLTVVAPTYADQWAGKVPPLAWHDF
jgi:hypothetical protein